jgi:pyruvate,water dikinase
MVYRMGSSNRQTALMLWFDEIRKEDVPLVGGKSASLGEMTSKTKVPIPYGFALTAEAYRLFIRKNALDKKIADALNPLKDSNDTVMLQKVGAEIRKMINSAQMPKELEKVIVDGYRDLAAHQELRHRGGSARREFRWSTGDLPEHHRRQRCG